MPEQFGPRNWGQLSAAKVELGNSAAANAAEMVKRPACKDERIDRCLLVFKRPKVQPTSVVSMPKTRFIRALHFVCRDSPIALRCSRKNRCEDSHSKL